jgi:hypothetical protein
MTRERLCTSAAVALLACSEPSAPAPPAQLVETGGPPEGPMGAFDEPDRPPPPDVPEPDDPVTTGVTTVPDPGVTTLPETPSFPPGITTIDPGVTTVDTLGPQPPGPPTGTEGPCFSVCDCPPGLSCLEGFCQATLQIRWCCTEAACPSGTQCETPDGRRSLCPP